MTKHSDEIKKREEKYLLALEEAEDAEVEACKKLHKLREELKRLRYDELRELLPHLAEEGNAVHLGNESAVKSDGGETLGYTVCERNFEIHVEDPYDDTVNYVDIEEQHLGALKQMLEDAYTFYNKKKAKLTVTFED